MSKYIELYVERRHVRTIVLTSCYFLHESGKKKIAQQQFLYINLPCFFFLFSARNPADFHKLARIIVIFRNNITEANCCYYDNDRHYGRARARERGSERGLVGACGRKRQYETPVMTGKEHRQPRAVFLLHAQACANHLPLFF